MVPEGLSQYKSEATAAAGREMLQTAGQMNVQSIPKEHCTAAMGE